MRIPSQLAALLLAAAPAAGQGIVLDDGIEGGNLTGWNFANGVYTVHDALAPGTWEWLHFRATGVSGQTPVFRTPLTNSNDVYRDYHRLVWRYAGERDWRYMDLGWLPGDGHYWFGNTQPFTQDVVEIAYWFPYGTAELQRFANAILRRGAPWLRAPAVVGASREGRPLPAFTFTDPAVPDAQKKQVVVVARQHGYESYGNYVVEGMVRFLAGPDPAAAALRAKAVVHVYPAANPDAAFHGWTREGLDKAGTTPVDLNRDWAFGGPATGGTPSATYEIDALRDDILARTGGSADFLIDVHAHAKGSQGLGWYWWYQGDPQLAQQFLQSVWDEDQLAFPTDPVFSWPSHSAGSGSTTAMDWGGPQGIHLGVGTLGGLGLTLEPIAAPFGANRTVERIRLGGETVLRGLEPLL
jgi:hypothetical protein